MASWRSSRARAAWVRDQVAFACDWLPTLAELCRVGKPGRSLESAALYLIKKHGLEDALYISSRPHSSYQRRVMVPGGRTDLMAFVDGVLSESSEDSEWLEIIERYR